MKKTIVLLMLLVLTLGVSVQAAEPEIPSAAGIVVNADTGEVYFAKEPYLEHAMASTTKVVTGILAIENTENYDGDVETRDRTLPAIETDLADSGDSNMGLVLGEQLTIYDAVRGMMYPSGNDAARLLARTIGKGSYSAFGEMMNAKAKELGCTHTAFTTASGRDAVGHYTCAADYAVLVNYAMSNKGFRELVGAPSYVIEEDPAHGVVRHELANGNVLMHGGDGLIGDPYPGATGVKGGNTSNAKRCLTFTATRTVNGSEVNLVSIVLGNETKADNWNSTRTLLDYGFERAGAESYTVTASGNKLTITNPTTGYTMSATITAPDTAYTGKAIEPAVVTNTYPEGTNWYQKWDVTYTNNTEVGTATASITYGGETASCTFEIVPDVTLTEDTTLSSLIVSEGQIYDLGGNTLTIENGLVVNNGGSLRNGTLAVKDGAVVALGENGGYVPVNTGKSGSYSLYDLRKIEIKAGKTVESYETGTKYSFGYKYDDFAAYAESVSANAADSLSVGVSLMLDDAAVDYSYSDESVAMMDSVGGGANSFFRINLKLAGGNNSLSKVRVAPMVKVASLGFKYVGEDTGEGSGKYVARINAQGYYTLEDAVAGAKELYAATGENVHVKLVDSVDFKRPVTLELNGHTRFVANARAKVTLSGPVTFDGMSDSGVEADGLMFRISGESTLTLKDGVVIRDHKNIHSEVAEYAYGAAIRVEGLSALNLDGVKFLNCSGRVRGAVYVTGTAKVDVKGCTFESNTARGQFGGAIGVYTAGTLNVENSTFIGNTAATYGGAIGVFSGDAVVTLKNNTFTDNTCGASSRGGAVGMSDSYNGEMVINGGSFSGNSVDDIGKGGGTVTLEGAITGLDEITLTPYETISVGDTLALKGTSSVVINDSVTLKGSAINSGKYITEDGMKDTLPAYIAAVGDARYLTLTAAIEATKNATAATTIELYGNETIASAKTVTLNPNVQILVTGDSVISGPLTIDGASAAHTAAVPVVVDGATLTLQNGVKLQNITSTFTESGSYHGIVGVKNSGTFTMDNATITKCTAPYGMVGGAAGSTYNIRNNSTLSYNNATTGSGGAVFLLGVTFNAENSTFDNNTAAAQGGAIHVGNVNAKVTMTNCTLTNNTAATRGGAISVYAGSKNVRLTGCTFTGNKSGNQGGAICVYGSAAIVVIDGATMSNNTATTSTTASVNDISYMGGSLELKGAIDITRIALNSGLAITLNETATFAKTVTLAGPGSGKTVLSGSKVGEYYTYFKHSKDTLTINSSGVIVAV